MPAAPATNPVPLAYACDLPSRYGIVYEVVGCRARIAVPNSSRLLYRVVALVGPILLLLYGGSYAIQSLDATIFGAQSGTNAAITRGVTFGAFAVLLLLGAYGGFLDWLLHPLRRVVLELDEDRFVVHDQDARDRPRARSWRRNSIGGITAGSVPWNAGPGSGQGLHVRVVGKTILEIMPGHEPVVAAWVAARLNEALAAPTPIVLNQQP